MKAKNAAYAIIVLAVVAMMAAAILSTRSSSAIQPVTRIQSAMAQSSTTTVPAQSNVSAQAPVLFSRTAYAPYAFQVFPGSMSQQASAAMSGFSMNTTALANGTTSISVSLKSTSQSQTIMLGPGYKLYVIETTFGDDGYGSDYSLGDDGFVLVNQTGYVV